jgi:amidase
VRYRKGSGALYGGVPSTCVPAGRDKGAGQPIGALINGRRLREVAEAIEARLGVTTPIVPLR